MQLAFRKPDPYTGPITKGIDVSIWQMHVDWKRVRAAGVVFAFIRAAYGVEHDRMFTTHSHNARAAGVVQGHTLYFRPGQDPIEQAKRFADLTGPYSQLLDLGPLIDIERSEGHDPQQVEDLSLRCIEQLELDFDQEPIIYAGYFVASSVKCDHLKSFPLMTPWYGALPVEIPKAWDHFTFHQVTNAAKVDGIMRPDGSQALVDADEFRGDLAAFNAFCRGERAVAPAAPAPALVPKKR